MSGWLLAVALALGDDGTGRCVLDRDPAIRRSGDDLALARELDRTGFPASAGLFYARAACEAPGDEDTLVLAISRANTWGAREDLESFARWLPVEKYPSRAPNLLSYVEGRRLRDAGMLDEAVPFLGRISVNSDLLPRGALMLGQVQALRGKLKTADAEFKSVVADSRDPEAQALVNLALGSLYYGIGRFEEAGEFARAAPDSAERDAMLGWVWFMTNRKLGERPGVAPLGRHPEVDFLRTIRPFHEMHPEDVEAEVAIYEATWTPVAAALEKALADLDKPGGGARLFERYRKGLTPVPGAPAAFIDRWTASRELAATKARRDQLLAERLGVRPPRGKDGEALTDETLAAMSRAERRGGELLARGVRRAWDELATVSREVQMLEMESLVELGDPRALDAMRRAQAKWPSGELAARIAIAEGGDVIAGLRRACDAFPASPQARYELALWLWQAGERDEAVSHFRQVGDGDRRRASRAHVGQYHFDRGEFTEAIEAFSEAEDSYMVAWCKWALGDRAAAVATMRSSPDKRAAADAARMERAIAGG